MIKLRQLRYFLALAEELHFGRAAERLAISQPPLSWNIKQLEEEMDVRLFERDSHSVRLTSAGYALVPLAHDLLERADDLVRIVRDTDRGIRGTLRIGFVGSAIYQRLPQSLRDFQKSFPKIRVYTAELNSVEQIASLVNRRIDLGFVHTNNLPDTIACKAYSSEPFVCCLPPGHTQAHAAHLPCAALKDEPFIMFASQVSPDYHERILSICTNAGFIPNIQYEVRHWLSVASLVSQGLGVALVPAALARAGIQGIAFVPLENSTIRSPTYCIWRNDDSNTSLHRFIASL